MHFRKLSQTLCILIRKNKIPYDKLLGEQTAAPLWCGACRMNSQAEPTGNTRVVRSRMNFVRLGLQATEAEETAKLAYKPRI